MVIRVFRYAIRHLSKSICTKFILQKLFALWTSTFTAKVEQNSTTDTTTVAQPLIQPTSTVIMVHVSTTNEIQMTLQLL